MDITCIPTRSVRRTGFASLTRAEGIILHPAATPHRDRDPHPRWHGLRCTHASQSHPLRWLARAARDDPRRPRLPGERRAQRENGRSGQGEMGSAGADLIGTERAPGHPHVPPQKRPLGSPGLSARLVWKRRAARRAPSPAGPVLPLPAVPLPARRSREVAVFPHGSTRSAARPAGSLFHLPLTRFPLIYGQWLYRA